MLVWDSGDVSLEGASFSECTADGVRLPRPDCVLLYALAADACPPQLAQFGGGMFVDNSGDVSLGGANFSECTSGDVRLPRPHTLASPAHARLHAIAAPEAGEEGSGTWGGEGGAFPKGPLWACPPSLAP